MYHTDTIDRNSIEAPDRKEASMVYGAILPKGRHRPSYEPEHAKALGSIPAAILFSEIAFWSHLYTNNPKKKGWVWWSEDELQEQTGIKRDTQRRAIAILTEKGVIEVDHKGPNRTRRFRVNWRRAGQVFRLPEPAQAADDDSDVGAQNLMTENLEAQNLMTGPQVLSGEGAKPADQSSQNLLTIQCSPGRTPESTPSSTSAPALQLAPEPTIVATEPEGEGEFVLDLGAQDPDDLKGDPEYQRVLTLDDIRALIREHLPAGTDDGLPERVAEVMDRDGWMEWPWKVGEVRDALPRLDSADWADADTVLQAINGRIFDQWAARSKAKQAAADAERAAKEAAADAKRAAVRAEWQQRWAAEEVERQRAKEAAEADARAQAEQQMAQAKSLLPAGAPDEAAAIVVAWADHRPTFWETSANYQRERATVAAQMAHDGITAEEVQGIAADLASFRDKPYDLPDVAKWRDRWIAKGRPGTTPEARARMAREQPRAVTPESAWQRRPVLAL